MSAHFASQLLASSAVKSSALPAAGNSAAVSLSLSAVAGDDVINAAELAGMFDVTGTSSGIEAGQDVAIDIGGQIFHGQTDANGNFSVAVDGTLLTGRSGGTGYIVLAKSADLAGNQAQASGTFAVDTRVSLAITAISNNFIINSAAAANGFDVTGTSGEAETGSTVTVDLGNGISATGLTNAEGNWTAHVNGPLGINSNISATATASVMDLAGNIATVSHSYAIVSVAPSITLDAIAGDGVLNASEAAAGFVISGTTSGIEDGQTISIGLNGHVYQASASGNAWSLAFSGANAVVLADTVAIPYSVTADVADGAGNPAVQAVQTLFVDTQAPAVAITGFTPDTGLDGTDHVTKEANITLTGTAEAGALVQVSDGGLPLIPVITGGDGRWSLDLLGLQDGNHSFTAIAVDPANNVSSPTNPFTLVVDLIAPATPGLTLPAAVAGMAGLSAVALNITGIEAGGEARASFTQGANTLTLHFPVASFGASGLVHADLSGHGFADGNVDVSLSGADLAGNLSPVAAGATFLIDLKAPAAPVIDSFNARTGVLGGTGEAGASLSLADNGIAIATTLIDAQGHWNVNIGTGLPNGIYHYSASATDAAGNKGANSALLAVTLGAGTASVSGGGPAVTFTGGSARNLLAGGAGNDRLVSGTGADTLSGGAGTDIADYSAATGAVYVDLAAGRTSKSQAGTLSFAAPASVVVTARDVLSSIENVVGSAFGDRLYGTAGNNVFTPGAGADIVYGTGGNDTVDYSNLAAGAYVYLQYNYALKALSAGAGWSTGSAGPSVTDSLSGISNVIGTNFDDRLYGSAGNNVFAPGLGHDIVYGLGGSDTVDYSSLAGGVYVHLASGFALKALIAGAGWTTGSAGPFNIDYLTGISNATGTGFDDRLYGTSGNNLFTPGAGNDIVYGLGGSDTIDYSTLAAGALIDLGFSLANGAGLVNKETRAGAAWTPANIVQTVRGGQYQVDYLAGISSAIGTNFGDVMRAGSGAASLRDGAGDDTIYAGAGNDTIDGGFGHNTIYASSGGGSLNSQSAMDFSGGTGNAFVFDGKNNGGYAINGFVHGKDMLDVETGTGGIYDAAFGHNMTGAILLADFASGLAADLVGGHPALGFAYATDTGALTFWNGAAHIALGTLALAPGSTFGAGDILLVS